MEKQKIREDLRSTLGTRFTNKYGFHSASTDKLGLATEYNTQTREESPHRYTENNEESVPVLPSNLNNTDRNFTKGQTRSFANAMSKTYSGQDNNNAFGGYRLNSGKTIDLNTCNLISFDKMDSRKPLFFAKFASTFFIIKKISKN